MSAENTKQHFAEICECIWSKIQGQEKLDRETAAARSSMPFLFCRFSLTCGLTISKFPEKLKPKTRKFRIS